ncbi:excalibur calcium-binding domain-containing protein [Sphingomonas sp. AR_OL41]|uniref:excalibur calcium-binding domain-containing protein n=1 Tax=Sphingomonas sp. AR_OL41 TaxID=3042729 RepID=UPI0024803D92|nr:excalibur calcium-binding domain-containing protein [Sphingomonas sp. AR_OL41]MDH7975529.1 excalibur calcium-binding domain-containing protein [Sphingomonas sp. AR_OL41]
MGIGVGSAALTENGRDRISSSIKPLAVAAGISRAREPQIGDYWRGCDDARAAGTAPIYAGEPGYREAMDGDSDGIACEPYRGR